MWIYILWVNGIYIRMKRMKSHMMYWICTMNVNVFHIESMWYTYKWNAWNLTWFIEFVRWMWIYFTLSQCDIHTPETSEISYDYYECECISHWVNMIYTHIESHMNHWICTINLNIFYIEWMWYTYTCMYIFNELYVYT